ncbi:MAG: hydroxypyruvate isomerase family protein [Burkholderiaceae bacterium]|nr:hydroxypyruvate isomerase family protein [Burkholderiaceae bacterium]
MPKFAANLSMMYPELPFLDRFEAAAKDGFKAVEFLFPYAYAPQELAARLKTNGLQQVLFNLPPGGTDAASIDAAWNAGTRGIACIPGRESELLAGAALALRYAEALDCPRLHMMAGLVPADQNKLNLRETYVNNAQSASKLAARQGINLLLEPINTRDIPGFFLNRQDDAHALIAQIGQPNVKVQMDLYHCQIVEGDVAMKIRQYLPTGNVGHFQIAGVPERQEPDVGEMNYPYLFDLIDSLGYDGWIGCEYKPRLGGQPQGTSNGLGWLQPYLK